MTPRKALKIVLKAARRGNLTPEEARACDLLASNDKAFGAMPMLIEAVENLMAWNEQDLDTCQGRKHLLDAGLHLLRAVKDNADTETPEN